MTWNRRLHHRAGITLIECLIGTSLIAVVSMGAYQMIGKMQSGLTLSEAKTTLRGSDQATINVLHQLLRSSVRLFDNTAAGNAYLGDLDLTNPPTPLGTAVLPTIDPTATAFAAGNVGNTLFFVSATSTTFTIPVTRVDSTLTTVAVSAMRFHYFYQAAGSGALGVQANFGTVAQIVLTDWQSIDYVNYNDLKALGAYIEPQAVTFLLAHSYDDGTHKYQYAWDSSADVANAFYVLDATIDTDSPVAHRIKFLKYDVYPKLPPAVMSGLRAGICPNTADTFFTGRTVPLLHPYVAGFPGGFEVAIVGPGASRSVYTRLVTMGGGTFTNLITDEEVVITSVRDIW